SGELRFELAEGIKGHGSSRMRGPRPAVSIPRPILAPFPERWKPAKVAIRSPTTSGSALQTRFGVSRAPSGTRPAGVCRVSRKVHETTARISGGFRCLPRADEERSYGDARRSP